MNTAGHGSANLGQDATMVQSNGAGYSSDHWASISPYSQSPYGNSPLNEYGATFGGFISHGLPSESLNRMPPPIQPSIPPPSTHQLIQPAPLMGSYSAPPLSIAPASSLPPVDPSPRPPVHHEKARKTLSAEQKRAMCQYHEDNPGTRQADIGAKFGVERSTVSKVLRHKDQYLKQDPEPDSSALKRLKGKHPDFDRTLSNYVRRQQQRGFEVKDEEIIEQARLFARASGSQDRGLTNINSNWLLKFKQKHAIPRFTGDKTNPTVSPVSPTQQLSPLSASRSDEDLQAEAHDFSFRYGHAGSHSSTSLASDLRDPSVSFPGDTISPTAPFHFSPDPNIGAFQNSLHIQPAAPDFQQHRGKRSNTFPSLNIDCVNQDISAGPLTPRHPSAVTSASTLESPTNDIRNTPFTLDSTVSSPPALRRSSSNSSIAARSNNPSTNTSSVSSTTADSSPTSPTPEDARRAAETLLNYLHSMTPNGPFDKSDYATIVQLTKKLQLHQHQTTRPSIGGLSRIPEGDDGEIQSLTETSMVEI
ncbi:tc5 transposase DNA-binding domain-containing protein [Trichoderma breve]|uniref:Tc5 transposase DNA-binding domain-containing protein n=1 Tax=Trichoderma breve TaxID=2034170 RepID=A0A9W9BFG6_9HYPO|nr:tc5 transposase DNA-binding domain-containing protein [Trichoderma breve]KAJ4860394.1 tc5 transposase DNA-binding domain-containing protein [Trichoderma breve]